MIKTLFHATVTKIDADKVVKPVEDAVFDALNSVKALVVRRLNTVVGTQYYSLAELRKAGHPYSRFLRGAAIGVPKDYVNLQSGEFYEAFDVYVGRPYALKVSLRVKNTDYKAAWIGRGTPRMVGRAYVREVMKGVDAAVMASLTDNVGKVFKVDVTRAARWATA